MAKKLFKELKETTRLSRCTTPWLVFESKNPDDETEEQFKEAWNKQLLLPEDVKNKLVSENTREKIQNIGNTFELKLTQLADISKIIRNYYFGNININNFSSILTKEAGVDPERAQRISRIITEQIIKDKSFEESYQASLESLQIKEALKKYPELGEQLITSEKITLANFPSPVRPSIKNWLSDYTFTMGYKKEHGAIERTNYLFHNNNTKKLNVPDRQKLSYLLKAFDENFPVTINKTTKQLIFPAAETASRPSPGLQPPSPFAEKGVGGEGKENIRFSSPQKMPFEKKSGLQPYRITPFDTNFKEKSKPDELKSKNIINLKE